MARRDREHFRKRRRVLHARRSVSQAGDARYLVNPPFTYGIEDTRDDAVKTAETFVKQLVMGVQK